MLMLAVCALGLLVSLSAKAAEGALYCVCTGSGCGNNAIGGDQGDIFGKLSPDVVETKFYSTGKTGWTYMVPDRLRGGGGPRGCYCGDDPCGNGGIGANPLTIHLGLSHQQIADNYGGGEQGNRTGWLCGPYRGTAN
ncbi:hypothetical protein CKO28_22630 [Rhodovibrio sodomensis]|uniref:Uncharacterized protein n=1 Tax=Rhodovibrio sodomensis TaxID=1088 RepID=A0ABS1DL22_9PROT|nr:hypothetical protein [Rhodovibrio sodomensis]MBK1670817.1 hypothetical protein [Rhodovibrio sodomensis]